MAPDRAYLIVSRVGTHAAPPHAGAGSRRTRSDQPARSATARRSRRGPTGPAPFRRPRPAAHAAHDAVVLVRRHRPGRHRSGGPGTRQYRPASNAGCVTAPTNAVAVRTGRPARRVGHGRHAAPRTRSAATTTWYGALLVVCATVMISGWFAASGASAVAQMLRP